MSTQQDCQVLVVGAGPVGLSLAVDLARRGVAVRIVDTLAAPTEESRAIVVHSRTLDHFEALGIIDEVMDASIVSDGMEIHADGRSVAAVGFDRIHAVHPYSVSLVQSETEAILAARLADLGVSVERGRTLTSYRTSASGLEATLTAADGSGSTVWTEYLVGADGARSAVRHLMGQQLDGSFVGDDVLLGDVEAEHDYRQSHFHAFFSPGQGTGLLFPLRGDRVRVFAQLPPGIDPRRPVTTEWLQSAMDDCGIEMRITGSHWLTRFDLKHGQVPRYRIDRVFLAGDAAHIHSPAGALGMNTGIQDAVNLGWKLAAALQQGGGARVLDSYHLERHPVGARVVAFTTAVTKVATIEKPWIQQARNALMHLGVKVTAFTDKMADTIEQQTIHYRKSPIVSGRGHSLHPGDFLYLPDTNVGAALASYDDHVAVLLPGSDSATSPPSIPLLGVTDADLARLAHATGLHHGGIVVVRPDGYVAHLGPEAAQGWLDYRRLLGADL